MCICVYLWICAYVYEFVYVCMSILMCVCLCTVCAHVWMQTCVCVHVCICAHMHLSVFCISPTCLAQQGMEVLFPKEKKKTSNKSLPTTHSNVFSFPSSWQLMFQLHGPPVLHGYVILDKVWLLRGTAEFIQRQGQRVLHPREKTHEEKIEVWESEVTLVERQVIDPCLESDMGNRDMKNQRTTITNFSELVIGCKAPPSLFPLLPDWSWESAISRLIAGTGTKF